MPSLPAFGEETAKLVHFRQLVEHASTSQADPLPVSFDPPNAYWTSTEKATFFQSLARHSRWRPDLVSEDIGCGKSVADVCSYIELLEQGSQEVQSTSHFRDTLPTAREVSDDWMRTEEAVANMLHEEEARWRKASLKRKRAEAVELEKKALQRDCQRGAQPRGGDMNNNSTDHGSDLEEKTWRERLKNRKQDLVKVWKREDFLSSLNEKYLKAMEIMVRTLEQGETEREMVVSMEAHQGPLMHTLSRTVPSPPLSSDTSVGPHIDASKLSSIDNSRISAGVSQDIQSLSHPTRLATTDTDPGPSESRARPQSLSPPAGAPCPSVPAELPRDLSPDSRRRLRKRLWMRRKRALSSGLPLEEVPTDVRKLKPGRKGKIQDVKSKAKLEAQAISPASPDSKPGIPREEDHCKDNDDLESIKRKNVPGWTKLERFAVDGSFLRSVGLDLFKLGNFAGLMSLLSEVYRISQRHHPGLEVASPRISYSYLLLFRAHLTHFLSRVIAQIVVQRQVEMQQKRRIGSRSHSNRTIKIKRKNVRETLNIMGHPSTNKRFFRRLKALAREAAVAGGDEVPLTKPDALVHSNNSDSSTLSDAASTPSDSDTDGFTDVPNRRGDGYSSGRRPLPDDFTPQSEFHLVWTPIGGRVDEPLLPENADEEELLMEFEAEEAVDRRDQGADREFEESLWEEISGQRQGLIGPVDISRDRPAGAKSLRFREPGGTIKSGVYIRDSDEDDGWEPWEGTEH